MAQSLTFIGALATTTVALATTTVALATAAIALAGGEGEAPRGVSAITCVNPASGASWQIRIDYDRGAVDSNPARIDTAEILWRDAANGWNYRLDRKSGALTVTLASATGGNFLFDRCALGD